MEITRALALLWMERLIAFAIALQTLELLQVRAAFSERGVFRWSIVRREFEALPRGLRAVLDALLSERGFVLLLVARLALASGQPWLDGRVTWPALTLLTVLVCLRFRGSYNGGSDAMTLVVLLSLTLARVGGDAVYERAGLAYAAVQLTLSYFVAGLVKLRDGSFARGEVLHAVLTRPPYARARAPLAASRLRVASLLVLAFELSFPLAWLGPRACALLLAAALAFHVANAFVLGLNRFVWAWLAAYPALLYWSAL